MYGVLWFLYPSVFEMGTKLTHFNEKEILFSFSIHREVIYWKHIYNEEYRYSFNQILHLILPLGWLYFQIIALFHYFDILHVWDWNAYTCTSIWTKNRRLFKCSPTLSISLSLIVAWARDGEGVRVGSGRPLILISENT